MNYRKLTKSMFVAAVSIGTIGALVFVLASIVFLDRGFTQPFSIRAPGSVLFLGLDSWKGYPNGLPDLVFLYDAGSGVIQGIPRDFILGNAEDLGLGDKGKDLCGKVCTVQNVYSYGAATDYYDNGISTKGADLVAEKISENFGIDSSNVVAFDLIYARSFLNRLGDVTVTDFPEVWLGPSSNSRLGDESGFYLGSNQAKLSGDDLYWFARSRQGSSPEERLERQSILILAIANQVSSAKIVTAGFKAKGNLHTDASLFDLLNMVNHLPTPGTQ